MSASQVLREIVARDMLGVPESVVVEQPFPQDDDVVTAISYADRSGRPRRGLVGVVRIGDDWLPTGSFSGRVDATTGDPVWQSWGGWSSGQARREVGAWVADPATATIRAVDDSGQTAEATVRQGVAVLFVPSQFGEIARVVALAADGHILAAAETVRTAHPGRTAHPDA